MSEATRRYLPLMLIVALGQIWVWGVARAEAPKTLVIAIGNWPSGLDPQTPNATESGHVESTLFDRIVNYKPGTAQLAPGLAESWTTSADGKVYTFKLRRGVSFHDGTPMNAHTVAEDIDRAINPQNPCYVLGRKVNTYDDVTFGSAKDGTVGKLEVLDDYTIRYTLPQTRAPFLQELAKVWQGIMSPSATKKYDCDASQHPAGTGPFRFVETVRDDHVTVEANPSYWGGRPKLDRIIFQVIPDSTTRLLKLERNEVQLIADVPAANYARIEGNPALKLYRQTGLDLLGVAMSNDWGPFTDKRVRQAMNYAVDKEAINKGLYNGAHTASQGLPPILAGYNRSVDPYPFNPSKARDLLKAAGYANGIATEFEMLAYSNPVGYNPIGGVKLGEAVQSDLAQVGVNVKVVNYEWAAYLQKRNHTKWQGFAVCGWFGDTGDPNNFLGNLFEWNEVTNAPSLFNCARFHDPAFDKLVVQGRETIDQAKRAQIYSEANKVLHDGAPWIFINNIDHVRAARANVTGFLLNPLQRFFNMELVSLQ